MTFNFKHLWSLINPAFQFLIRVKSRYLILYGGAGSGKSYFITQWIVLRILMCMAVGIKHKALVLRKTLPAVKHSVLPVFLEVLNKWKLNKLYTLNKTDSTITFINGSQIVFKGMDDPEKIKSIFGLTIIWLEEATEFDYADFMQLDLRLRGDMKDYKQIFISFNPIGENHWIKQRFFDDPADKKKIHLHHSTVYDNPLMKDDEYVQILDDLKHTDINQYNIYRLGLWGVLEGKIYEGWDLSLNEWPDIESFDYHGFGLDFGYTNDPTAIIECGIKGGDLYLREQCYERKLTNPDICSKLGTITTAVPYAITVADCAEPKSIAEIRQGSFNIVPCIKGKDSVFNGIQRIKQYKVHVYSGSTNLIKEYNTYKWAEKKDTALWEDGKAGKYKNEPVKFMDHGMDAVRYFVTKMVGVMPADLLSFTEQSKREARLELLAQDDYNEFDDDELWEDY